MRKVTTITKECRDNLRIVHSGLGEIDSLAGAANPDRSLQQTRRALVGLHAVQAELLRLGIHYAAQAAKRDAKKAVEKEVR